MKKKLLTLSLMICVLMLSSCGQKPQAPAESWQSGENTESTESTGSAKGGEDGAESGTGKVADSSDYTAAEEIDDSGLTPVTADELNDGEYDISMRSSSSMFKVAQSTLLVKDGALEAVLRIESDSYEYLYAGTAEEAASAASDSLISYDKNDAGDQLYTVPVEALDKALPYASFSRKKEKWYDRTLLFESSSLPEDAFKEARYKTAKELGISDGTYTVDVTLEGGSGKASVESPAVITVEGGQVTATLVWSSDKYDYMLVEGEKYIADTSSGASVFSVPVKGFDGRLPVTADTTAMSKPYEIEYTLYFDSSSIKEAPGETGASSYKDLKTVGDIKLEYSSQLRIREYEGGIYEAEAKGDRYLLVPCKAKLPMNIPEDTTVIRTPVQSVYVASTSSMDFFTKLDALGQVAFSGGEASKWTDKKVAGAVESGQIAYAGKYDVPDYEMLITKKADLAVENSMIYHSPETKEKLEELSIPVLVDLTSYEEDPRGRVEWIKLYGLLTGHYDESVRYFEDTCKRMEDIIGETKAAKGGKAPTVVYFYIDPKGSAGVRKSGDYVSRMIELAGGRYAFPDLKVPEGESTSSSVDMSMEDFYLKGKDADILIYNSTLYGVPGSVKDLVSETALLSEFRAVKEGRVYASLDEMFQATCSTADMTEDLYAIISGKDKDMTYFKKLK